MLISESDNYSAIEMRHLRALVAVATDELVLACRGRARLRAVGRVAADRGARADRRRGARGATRRSATGLADTAGPDPRPARRADAGSPRRRARRPARAGGRRGRARCASARSSRSARSCCRRRCGGSGPTCRRSRSACSRTRTSRCCSTPCWRASSTWRSRSCTTSIRASSRSSWCGIRGCCSRPATRSWRRSQPVPLAALGGLPMIEWQTSTQIADVETRLARLGITIDVVFRTDDNLTLQHFVGAGLGYAIAGRLVVEPGSSDFTPLVLRLEERLEARRIGAPGRATARARGPPRRSSRRRARWRSSASRSRRRVSRACRCRKTRPR